MTERDTTNLQGRDSPWPLSDVLTRLADAADHLLRDHDCDAHGWEGVTVARDKAREYAAALSTRETPDPSVLEQRLRAVTLDRYDDDGLSLALVLLDDVREAADTIAALTHEKADQELRLSDAFAEIGRLAQAKAAAEDAVSRLKSNYVLLSEAKAAVEARCVELERDLKMLRNLYHIRGDDRDDVAQRAVRLQDRAEQAEQRLTVLEGARERIEALERIVPSDLEPDEVWKRNVEYVRLEEVLEALGSSKS